MASCERCWAEARAKYADGMGDGESHVEVYEQLIRSRDAVGEVCTPEQQAGQWWDAKRQADRRFDPVDTINGNGETQ